MTDRHDAGDHELDGSELERFFRAARTAAPEPSPEFLTRLVAQGIAAQRQAPPAVAPRSAPRRGGVFATLATALGGWGALGGMAGGMATATVAGLWIGLAGAPTLVQAVGFAAVVQSGTDESYLPDADILALAMTE